MKVVIPMSGLGSRFVKAGYQYPKPLIEVHGRPIIEYVIDMFPGEIDFIFICRNEHLETTHMRQTLEKLMPTGKIVGIPGHKLGPNYAVLQVKELIDDNEPVIVNYCDYYMEWDYADFKKTVFENKCDGAIPCYTGFHPHLLPAHNFYAGCNVDEHQFLTEIREKYSFTEDKTKSNHSAGMYYFAKGAYIKKYFQQQIDQNVSLNGEFYTSLVYNLLVQDGLKIYVYNKIPHFCQWGTPEDMQEYLYWSGIFENIKL